MKRERIGVCEGVLRSGSFEEDVASASAAGVHGLGLSSGAVDPVGVGRAAQLLADAGMVPSSHMTDIEILVSPRDSPEDPWRAIEVAAGLGAPGVLVRTGPLGDRTIEDADRRCVEWFAEMGSVAAQHGVRLMLEPMHPLLRPFSYVHTLRHAYELVAEAEAAGICADVGHLWWDRHLIDDFAAQVDRIVTVQVTDVNIEGLEHQLYEREQLGRGELPLPQLLSAFEAAGYKGFYEIEILIRIPRAERVGLVRDAREWLEAL